MGKLLTRCVPLICTLVACVVLASTASCAETVTTDTQLLRIGSIDVKWMGDLLFATIRRDDLTRRIRDLQGWDKDNSFASVLAIAQKTRDDRDNHCVRGSAVGAQSPNCGTAGQDAQDGKGVG